MFTWNELCNKTTGGKLLIHKCIEKYFAKGYYPSPHFRARYCCSLLRETTQEKGEEGGFEQKPADTFMLTWISNN